MDSGVKNMLENNKYEELTNLYELFKFYEESLHKVAIVFRAYIEKRGNALRENKEIYKDPKKMVPQLIDLQKEINTLVKNCFKNNDILQSAKDRAFYEFMKADYYSKQVAYFLDYCMRTGFKGKDEASINGTLDDIIGLFKNLNTKYVFQKETEKKMSDRLIKGATLSVNNEKNFVSKLKQESDISLVNKMVGMLNDLEKNKQETEDYRRTSSRGTPNGIKFNVQVISNGAWEIDNKHIIKINLPQLFSTCMNDFESYYIRRYKEHKLIWYLNISKLEILYLYLQNKNISISTLPQAIILLNLEKAGTKSIKDLAKDLECDVSIVKDAIDGLIYNATFNPKSQNDKGVLISTTATNRNFNDTDEFKINEKFVSLKQKFTTIPMPKKKTEEEIKNEEKISEEDNKRYRDYLIQSNLTRIMKSRIGQVTTHNWLVSETAKQIDRFKAQPQQIKDNIEKLIEKNCIKRDEKNKGCYEYVA
jgi:DNA-binding MarR family transcriptional regulator